MDDKLLTYLVFIFIFTYTSASSEIKKVFACQNQDKTLEFGYDISPDAVIRYTKAGEKPKLVASEQNGIKIYYSANNDSRIEILGNRNLYFKNVSTLDDGLYIREIRNGGTHVEKRLLKIYVSPSGFPRIKNFTDSKGHVYIKCEGPLDLGKPKAALVVKDSMDRIKDGLSYTINDDEYKCCLEGESVQKCYPKDIPTCTSYNIKKKTTDKSVTTDKTITTGGMCKSSGNCKMVATLVWCACVVVLLVWIIWKQTLGTETNISIPLCQRTRIVAAKLKDKYFFSSVVVSCVVSILAIVISTGYFCSKTDCDKPFYPCLIGIVCSLVLYFAPSFQKMTRAREISLGTELETAALMVDFTKTELMAHDQEVESDQPGLDNAESRKQLRKYRKIDVLKKGLSHTFWNTNQKEAIKNIFKPEYMSSEESEYEDNEKTKTRARKRYKIKRIPWENKKMTALKESLYRWYEVYERKSRYEHDNIERRRCNDYSSRSIPKDAPEWAVKGSSSEFLEFITSDTGDHTTAFV